MKTYLDIEARAASDRLAIFGAFHPTEADTLPMAAETLLLLGPLEPGFWPHFRASPEAQDGAPDPMDRWSSRVIGAMAHDVNAAPLFPFSGPPWHPFVSWALRSGRAWQSPVSLLVHDSAGLLVSYRGALALPDRIALPDTPPDPPCAACDQPCLDACPVGALTQSSYDTKRCHSYLETRDGADCMSNGCKVRRSCPISTQYARQPDQSAFHMRSFHK